MTETNKTTHADEAEDAPPPPGARFRTWLIMGIISAAAIAAALWVQAGGEGAVSEEQASVPPKARVVETSLSTQGSIPLIAHYRGELRARVAELAAESTGRLLEVRVNLGDHFEDGEVLAVVDSAETGRLLGEARAQAQSATATSERVNAQLETAKLERSRGKELEAENLATKQELLALESQVTVLEAELRAAKASVAAANARVSLYREQLGRTRLTAPFAGAVADRYLDPGATVSLGTPVLRLVKDGPLEIRFRASELHLTRLQTGIPLSVSTLATGDDRFDGKLERISAEVQQLDRSLSAEGKLLAVHAELRPGMYARVDAQLGVMDDATLVPEAALVSRLTEDGGAEQGLFVVDGGQAHYVELKVMGEYEGRAAVVPLKPGVKVVVKGQDRLSEAAPVREVVSNSERETSP